MPLILIMIGLILIIYNYRAIKMENEIKPEDDSFNISFQSVLQDNKEELNDYKMEIGLLRRDMAESLTELQEEIMDIKNSLSRLKNNEDIYENKEDVKNKYFLQEDKIDNENNKVEETNKIDEFIGEADEKLFADSYINEESIGKSDFLEKVDSNKTKRIKDLLKEGLTDEEICHKLFVSKGEVLLVKGLFKK